MRVVHVDKLRPGLIVGRPIVDETGTILLHDKVPLTDDYIQALKTKGFERIYVRDPAAAVDVVPDDDLNPVLRAKALQAMRGALESIQKSIPEIRSRSFEDMVDICNSDVMRSLMSASGPFAKIDKVIGEILDEILTNSVLSGLTSLKSASEPMYAHSLDVCVVAIMIGNSCGIPRARLRQLAMGCLLHDIGKIFVSPSSDPISQIRQHTLLGYELLKNNDDPDIMAPHVALEHHEHQDGTGEPRGLISSNTLDRNRDLPPPIPTLIGEIAAIANAYDNLLSGSDKRPPLTPDEALNDLRAGSGTRFNRAVLQNFLRVVPVYPLGTEIVVRSEQQRGFSGIVTEVKPTQLDRPVIALLLDARGKPIDPLEIDLGQEEKMLIKCKGA